MERASYLSHLHRTTVGLPTILSMSSLQLSRLSSSSLPTSASLYPPPSPQSHERGGGILAGPWASGSICGSKGRPWRPHTHITLFVQPPDTSQRGACRGRGRSKAGASPGRPQPQHCGASRRQGPGRGPGRRGHVLRAGWAGRAGQDPAAQWTPAPPPPLYSPSNRKALRGLGQGRSGPVAPMPPD